MTTTQLKAVDAGKEPTIDVSGGLRDALERNRKATSERLKRTRDRMSAIREEYLQLEADEQDSVRALQAIHSGLHDLGRPE